MYVMLHLPHLVWRDLLLPGPAFEVLPLLPDKIYTMINFDIAVIQHVADMNIILQIFWNCMIWMMRC